MEGSRLFRGRTPSSAPDRDHDRRRLAGFKGTVKVHGTVPGSCTMRRAGEIFAMQPVTRDGTGHEE